MTELREQLCWITGATGGIGKATSELLAKKGVNLILSDLDEAELYQHTSELEKLGVKVIPLPLDVSNLQSVKEAGNMIKKEIGNIDILINGAGISPKGLNGRVSSDKLDIEEWHQVLDINLNGSYYCSREAIKMMKENNKGNIVNISSQAGRTYSAVTAAHYAVSKAGLIALTRQMAGELGSFGINVNAIAPGRIDTKMIWDVPKDMNEEIVKNIPLRRLGTPEEVANTILFLTTSQSSYITGAVIDINGGRAML